MLRVIDENEKTVGYKCSECLSDVVVCNTVCRSCGRELVYPYFMPSTAWWARNGPEERERVRREALDITIALVKERGTDWRDIQAPFNRFLGGDHADRFVRENLAVTPDDIERLVEAEKKKLKGRITRYSTLYAGAETQLKSAEEKRLRSLASWEPKEAYPFANRFITAVELKEIESQLPVTLIHEEYLD